MRTLARDQMIYDGPDVAPMREHEDGPSDDATT